MQQNLSPERADLGALPVNAVKLDEEWHGIAGPGTSTGASLSPHACLHPRPGVYTSCSPSTSCIATTHSRPTAFYPQVGRALTQHQPRYVKGPIACSRTSYAQPASVVAPLSRLTMLTYQCRYCLDGGCMCSPTSGSGHRTLCAPSLACTCACSGCSCANASACCNSKPSVFNKIESPIPKDRLEPQD